MITLDEARQRLFDVLPEVTAEPVRLEDGLGRVAAVDLAAPRDLPAEPRSRLDGYAVRSDQTADASADRPVRRRLTSWTVTAGHLPFGRLAGDHCARVTTGAVLPEGADSVVPQEDVLVESDHIVLTHSVKPLSGLTSQGAEARKGDLLVSAGEVLTPSRLAMIAAFGLERVPVAVRPRVALLSTGDEVREPGEPHAPGIIYSNNRLLLGWLARLNGGLPLHLGVCRDDPVEISDRLERVEADLYVTTGGTGRGDKDVVLNAWSRLGVETVFKGVAVSPGRGTLAGLRRGKPYLALPGGPWAGRIIFEELIKPLLWRFQGIRFRWPPSLKALLADRVVNDGGGAAPWPGTWICRGRWPRSCHLDVGVGRCWARSGRALAICFWSLIC